MGSATAGLFSAAKSSIRRVEKTTDTISKAPDVTKDQKFGINYVQFFGSKKNSKILKKSLQSIRDSLVATFAIAKLLRSEVSKNVKLIGDKTKKNKGLFGIGLGGVLGLISLLTNPILGVLGIGAGVAAGGFLIKFLYDNRDNIINFIMDKAKGLYDFLQSFVSNVVRDFLSDRAKSPELRNLEFKSEDRIDARQKELEKGDEEKGIEPLLPNDARVQAVEEEINRLSKEQLKIDAIPPRKRTEEQNDRLNALNARINELKTGEVTTDRLNPFAEFLFGNEIRDTIKREAPFLQPKFKYGSQNEEKKLELLDKLFRKFKQGGNDPDMIKQIYGAALDSGELTADEEMQAKDMMALAEIRDQNKRDKKGEDFNVKERFEPSPMTDNNVKAKSNNKKVSTENTGGVGGGGEKTAFNPKIGGGSDLAQQPVSASSSPEMIVHNNFDADNPYRDSNASLLGIFAV